MPPRTICVYSVYSACVPSGSLTNVAVAVPIFLALRPVAHFPSVSSLTVSLTHTCRSQPHVGRRVCGLGDCVVCGPHKAQTTHGVLVYPTDSDTVYR